MPGGVAKFRVFDGTFSLSLAAQEDRRFNLSLVFNLSQRSVLMLPFSGSRSWRALNVDCPHKRKHREA